MVAGISDLLGGLGGAIGGGIGLATAPRTGKKELKQALDVLKKVKDPEYDMRDIPAAQLTLFAEYFPDVYQAVVPEDVRLPEDDAIAKQSQLQMLSGLREISETGMPEVDRQRVLEFQRGAGQVISRADEALRRRLQQQGRLGAGAQMMAQESARREGSNVLRDLGQAAQRDALLRRLDALRGGGALAGEIRGQTQQMETAQARQLDDFNRWKSRMKTQEAINAAEQQNIAQLRNITEQQRIQDENARAQREAALENVNRQNELRNLLSQFQLQKAGKVADVYGTLADYQNRKREQYIKGLTNIGTGAGQATGGGLQLGGLI